MAGVTGVMIGAVDLSQAMGLRGQPRHPDVRSAVERAMPVIHAAGKVAGVPKDSAAFRDHRARGACVVTVHAKALLTAASAQHIAELGA